MDEHADLEYAGFWSRTGATLIDTFLVMLMTFPILIGIYGTEYLDSEKIYAGAWDVLITWVIPAVVTVLFWVYRAATPGKMAVKAKILDANTGKQASTGQLVGRYLAYFLSMLPLCLGFFWIAFDQRKQGWHDKLAGTVVVKSKYTGPEPVKFNS